MLGAFTLIWWSHVLLLLQGSYGLRMVDLEVPSFITRGEPVTMNCTFDLERERLYSIRWFKDNMEFYRYTPSDDPPGQMSELEGIFLDSIFPHGTSIHMNETDLNSEGLYECEVSTEAPFFRTMKNEKMLRVYVFPDRVPIIMGDIFSSSIGETLNVTCMSLPSKPVPVLEWQVNDEEVEENEITRLSPLRDTDGLQSSRLGLQIQVLPHHYDTGVLNVKCTAFESKFYLTTKSEIVATNKPKTADNPATISHDGPKITGGKLRYAEQDVVNVTCTSDKSQLPADLTWYINNNPARRDYLRVSNPIRFPDGVESTVLGLSFTVESSHFRKGQMKLKCVATLFKVTNMHTTELVVSDRPGESGITLVMTRN